MLQPSIARDRSYLPYLYDFQIFIYPLQFKIKSDKNPKWRKNSFIIANIHMIMKFSRNLINANIDSKSNSHKKTLYYSFLINFRFKLEVKRD